MLFHLEIPRRSAQRCRLAGSLARSVARVRKTRAWLINCRDVTGRVAVRGRLGVRGVHRVYVWLCGLVV